MTDEFYYVIKLVTGEEIFAIASLDVDKDGNNIVILCNPVTMKIIKRGLVSGIKVEPWMKIPDEDVFTINMDKVITISQVCLLYTSPSPRDLSTSRMPSSA